MFERFMLLFFTLFSVVSCATVTQGPKQNVGVSSSPTGADVYIDGRYVGKTPLRISLSRSSPHAVRIVLDGYEPYVAEFSRKGNVMTAGNILVGGVIGLGVDCLSGAIFRLSPEQIHANLYKIGSDMSLADIENCEDCFVFAVNSADTRANCLEVLR